MEIKKTDDHKHQPNSLKNNDIMWIKIDLKNPKKKSIKGHYFKFPARSGDS